MSFIQDPRNKMALYFIVGIGFYLFALALGLLAKLLFGIQFITVDNSQVDVVTYIIIGAVSLILELIQLFLSLILIALVWIYNGFFVNFIFKIPLFDIIFGSMREVPESSVQELVRGLIIIKEMALFGATEIFTFIPDEVAEWIP